MSKIAEKKALEAYPIDIIPDDDTMGFTSSDRNEVIRLGYIRGYDQAMKDTVKDSEHLKYLSDEMGYAYACGCRKTMQDFLEEACEWLLHNTMRELVMNSESTELVEDFIEDFKNHMQNESEN